MCIYCIYLHVHTFTYQKLEMFKRPSVVMFVNCVDVSENCV